MSNTDFAHSDNALTLNASRVPWDEAVFGCGVARIDELCLTDQHAAAAGYAAFERWCDALGIAVVSCRLVQSQMQESLFLEERGFRFIESILTPVLAPLRTARLAPSRTAGLLVEEADSRDLAQLNEIAATAFDLQRYHLDPRIDTALAHARYARWVGSTMYHPSQRLFKIVQDSSVVAFFIIEPLDDDRVYWHLTAMAPEFRGRGLGASAWSAMIAHHEAEGFDSVSTRISTWNIAALNLYSSLNFRFGPSETTLHRVNTRPAD